MRGVRASFGKLEEIVEKLRRQEEQRSEELLYHFYNARFIPTWRRNFGVSTSLLFLSTYRLFPKLFCVQHAFKSSQRNSSGLHGPNSLSFDQLSQIWLRLSARGTESLKLRASFLRRSTLVERRHDKWGRQRRADMVACSLYYFDSNKNSTDIVPCPRRFVLFRKKVWYRKQDSKAQKSGLYTHLS